MNKTKVIFRKDKHSPTGEIIAVFPSVAGDNNPYRTCAYYAHFGQHGAMAIEYMCETVAAKSHEYFDLMKELISLGYDLKVASRFSRKDLQSRINQVKG